MTDTGVITDVPIGCSVCGHLACVCSIKENHPDPDCQFRVSATCPVAVECDHGYDVCPMCDPCTCSPLLYPSCRRRLGFT